jgi:glutamyl-tRNA synthetase
LHPWEKGEAKGISIESRKNDKGINWRFWVPEGEVVTYCDERRGDVSFEAGEDFGDFLIWRKDGIPSYELAVVVDDIAMGITEVVRGEDLLLSTARQLLLYRALGVTPPKFYHCPLLYGEDGRRLAKRNKAMGLRELRARGIGPEEILDLIQKRKQ